MTRALLVKLQSDIKASIINGMSTTMISEKFGVSRGVLSKYRQEWFPDELCNLGNRPVIVGVKSKSLVRQLLLEGNLLTACDAYKKFLSLGYSLGYKTTLNVLKSIGFHSRIKQRKPMISHTNIMERRYRWAKKYHYWTVDDWKRVVFSDETKVNVWGSDGCKYYWSRPNDPLKPHHLDVKVKHGGGHIMIWGCVTYWRPGYACQVYDGTMKSEDYQQILATTLRESLECYGLSWNAVYFQQYNDFIHPDELRNNV